MRKPYQSPGRMKNSSYYIAPVGDWTHDLPHTVASNMVKVSHALNHSATEAVLVRQCSVEFKWWAFKWWECSLGDEKCQVHVWLWNGLCFCRKWLTAQNWQLCFENCTFILAIGADLEILLGVILLVSLIHYIHISCVHTDIFFIWNFGYKMSKINSLVRAPPLSCHRNNTMLFGLFQHFNQPLAWVLNVDIVSL